MSNPTRAVVVVGHQGDLVTKKISEDSWPFGVGFVEQRRQLGTGDAALVGLSGIPDDDDDGDVVVLPGDTPLLRPETIAALVEAHRSADRAATVLTAVVDDATGYGRVVRNGDGTVARIVEHRDATDEQLEIDEINTSIYCFRTSLLAPAIRRVNPDNAQGEFYLTDVVEVLAAAGHSVGSVVAPSAEEAAGVNDRRQLAFAETELRRRTNERLMAAGVTFIDPANTYVDTTVAVGRDVTIFPGTMLHGATVIGDRCEIGPNCRLSDCDLGADARIESVTATSSRIGPRSVVGPFVVLEPGTVIPENGRVGPFYTSGVEM